jgi:hypothetical protein
MAQVPNDNPNEQPVALIETPGNAPPIDILEIADPPRQMKIEMRMATKTPSEWLRLLCRDWCQENESILSSMDDRFVGYKSYLKGRLTSQLLCRLSSSGREVPSVSAPLPHESTIDFWKILGVQDEFDRAHIVANVERFCSLYNIRGASSDELDHTSDFGTNFVVADQGMPVEGAAAAAAMYQLDQNGLHDSRSVKSQQTAIKNEMRKIKAENRERDREEYTLRKAAEKAARDQTREERRQRKLAMKKQREEYAQQQKAAAFQRAAELVQSNRIPIEITRGAAKTGTNMPENASLHAAVINVEPVLMATSEPPPKKIRSSIVISTASDLHQIVTHSNNLWAKYNAIAKEHNQRVNWVVVAKELGIHVKVREKYARMHSRALARGFDFVNWGHYRIKDYPQYFTDPLTPSIEATLKANAISAPGTTHMSVSPVFNNTGFVNASTQDAIALAAQVAYDSSVGTAPRDDASMRGESSAPPVVHGFASEVPPLPVEATTDSCSNGSCPV